MELKRYPILDIVKFISALLVIAIHCAPFVEINETFNFVFVQIVARLAVPFFFITSGFLFFRKLDPQKGYRDQHNTRELKMYGLRVFKIYVIWSLLYLPILMVRWIQGGFDATTLLRLGRDFLFTGTYYHLWFLPALLCAIPLVYLLYMCVKRKVLIGCVVLLYLLGTMFNVYGEPLQQIALLKPVIQGYEAIFVTARNGLFFGPVFVAMGIYVREFEEQKYRKQSGIAFAISFFLLCLECFCLREVGIMRDLTSMYVMLVPTIFFFFIFLLQIPLKSMKYDRLLRQMSLLLYVSHIYFVVLFLDFFQLPNLLVYVMSILGSCILSYLILKSRKRFPFTRFLY